MAGKINFDRYDKSDWVRVPGRRFRNLKNPKLEISRRQFDKHYGATKFFGSNERKAKVNARSGQQLLRPARGRKSALKLTPEQKQSELAKRREDKVAKDFERKLARTNQRKSKAPNKITLRNFPKGKSIRRFRTSVSRDEIEKIRSEGNKSKIIWGYWVGLELVSERTGQLMHVSLFGARDILMPFTQQDFEDALIKASSISYATLTGMFIALHLTAAASKRNGVKMRIF